MNYKTVALFLVLFECIPYLAKANEELETEWSNFKTKHGKSYKHPNEEARRKKIFKEKLSFVKKHNAEHAQRKHKFTVGINEFSDLSHEEFNQQMKGHMPVKLKAIEKQQIISKRQASFFNNPLPSFVNWTAQGYVTPVKNQNPCGSCWTFSGKNKTIFVSII